MVAIDTENMGLNNIIRKWYKKFMIDWMESSPKILWGEGRSVLIRVMDRRVKESGKIGKYKVKYKQFLYCRTCQQFYGVVILRTSGLVHVYQTFNYRTLTLQNIMWAYHFMNILWGTTLPQSPLFYSCSY